MDAVRYALLRSGGTDWTEDVVALRYAELQAAGNLAHRARVAQDRWGDPRRPAGDRTQADADFAGALAEQRAQMDRAFENVDLREAYEARGTRK